MAFVSVEFLVFIGVICLIYFLVPAKAKWGVLLMASYMFYAFSSIKMLVFLLFTTVTTFAAGRSLGRISKETKGYIAANKGSLKREEKKAYKEGQIKKKRRVVLFMVLANLGILIFLKYFNFLAGNANQLLGIIGVDAALPTLSLFLPLGISFYTLQAIGYVVDVYREKYEPDTNVFQFALFMSFFPQIVQGPIARYDHLAHQLYEPHKFDYDRVTKGAQLILWGFMKKLVLADRVAILVNQIFDNYTQYEGITLFIGAVGYSLQIYGDFSGGMDIALFEVDEALRTIRDASTTEINIIYGATINPDLGEDLIVTVIATGFDETNATAKPVEMLIGDNRNKKTTTPQAEQEAPTTPEQPKPSQPKRQPFGGDNVEMIPNWLMNRYK